MKIDPYLYLWRRKISKTFAFLKTEPCPYLVKYSLDVLKKKTKVLDKKCFMKVNVESSPPEIKIRFHNGFGSPSLIKTLCFSPKAVLLF